MQIAAPTCVGSHTTYGNPFLCLHQNFYFVLLPQNLLDLDQRDIVLLLENYTDASFTTAKGIYTAGANSVGYSLRNFSINNDKQMRVNGDGEYYVTFQKFVDYYGSFDYADKLISAAYDATSVDLGGKEFDFSTYSFEGRAGTFGEDSKSLVCVVTSAYNL